MNKIRTFEIITLGCKVNEYETRYYQEQLEKLGLIEINRDSEDEFNSNSSNLNHSLNEKNERSESEADVVIINTCTVTNTAAAKSRKKIRKARKENPEAIVVIVGCYAQVVEPNIAEGLQADVILGSSHKSEFGAWIEKLMNQRGWMSDESNGIESKERKLHFEVSPIEDISDFDNMPIGHFEHQHRAFLKIQDGCNQYCAYCQIPLARGPERSQIPAEVIKTARSLTETGHLELVLTGIHTGRYSFRKTNLSMLLSMLLEETDENVTFRISSIEITEVTDELLDLMAQNPRILPHLHIPIQAGSDETLARMKRPYTVEQFKKRVSEIRKKVPDISISTDVITGFVQESDEEFAQTVKNLEEIGFSFLHVFPYSRRKGTAADKMSGFIDAAVAKKRTHELLKLSDQLRQNDMKRFKTSEILLERPENNHPDIMLGYTKQYHPAKVLHPVQTSGRIEVKILGIEDGVFICEEIQR